MKEKLITKSFERLLDKGKNRGFITYEELGKSLGKRGGSLENTERAFLIIADNTITLVKKNQSTNQLKKEKMFHHLRRKPPTKVMIRSECIYEKWEVSSFYLERVKSLLQKGLRQGKM